VETLTGRQCNFISWSPAGGVIIMASLGDSASGTLEFYDVATKNNVVKEHYRANQLSWDPSGRSVASVVSQPIGGGSFKFAMDNGYILWSFQGKQLYQQSYETFYQFLWRPRESLLSRAEINKVKRNLKKYEKQFDKADRKRQRARYLEETKGKRAERSKFRELLARNKAIRAKTRAEHLALLGGYDSGDEKNYKVHDLTVEYILSTKEEVVV
jgi:translation initiation factor 3 subunit B